MLLQGPRRFAAGYGVFDHPIILDLLDAAGVTWKVYDVSWDSVPFGNTDNVFVFWKKGPIETSLPCDLVFERRLPGATRPPVAEPRNARRLARGLPRDDGIQSNVLTALAGSVCIYRASDPEAIRGHAQRVGAPADEPLDVATTASTRPDPVQ